ncbi:MAG: hypothetical protein JXR84_07955, partial [Anaerolineae bacterium]|nr:hypothetical protein [Anaerolineae bacterium]
NIDTGYSIEGYTWVDANNNGWSGTTGYDTIPTTDQALPNVKMDLYLCADADGLPIAQITNRNSACGYVTGEYWKLVETIYTDGDGYYLFDGLRPGYYNVRANGTALPAGMTTRSAEATGDANGAGAAGGNGEWNEQAGRIRDLHYLGSSTSRTDVSFGYRNSTNGTVTGYVWQDQDQGGYNDWDSGELPITGVQVTLWLCDTYPTCSQVDSTTTNDYGYYQFSSVAPTTGGQTYTVVVTPPNGMDQTADPDYTSGSCYGTGNCDDQTIPGGSGFTLAAGYAHGPDYFGYYGGLSIGDTVYTDWNGDGDQDTGEEGIGGVKVRIYRDLDGDGTVDTGDTLLDTYDTLYNIIDGGLDINNDGVIDGNDDKTLLNGYQIINGEIDLSGNGTITTDGADDGTFMGYTVVNGRIDVDGGGVSGSDDASTLGFYEFTDLPGNGADYLVIVDDGTLPAGYVQTGDRDSTMDNKTMVELTTADVDDADFGYQPRGFSSIGDFVWNDINANGVQDAREPGVNGVLVNLYQDQDGDGVIDTEDALVAYTTTGIGVINGYLDVDGVSGITSADDSPALLGIRIIDGALDINNDGVVNTLDDGTFAGYAVIDGLLDMNGVGGITADDDGTLNGLYQFRDLPAGDYIVEIPDSNFDQSTDPLYKMLQTYDQDTTTRSSFDNQDQIALGANENYTAGDFGYANSSIGDFIWLDSNGDGLWENGEVGMAGVVVQLYCDPNNTGNTGGAGVTLCGTTATDANGLYLFGGLEPNNYIVKVADSNFTGVGVLVDYTLTGDPNSYNTTPGETSVSCLATGAQECDGENWLQGITAPDSTFFYGLQLGYNDMGSDFGYQPPAIIGDFVWQDFDGDGVQDPGEPGIAGVDVFLCSSSSPCTTGSGDYLATATTNSDGYYYFTGRPAGTYVVSVDTTDLPAGMTQTGDPEQPGVTCTTCDHSGNADTTGPVSDLSNDFGYRGSAMVAGTIFFDIDNDGGLYGSGTGTDVPFPGVPVYLYDSTGALVGSTLTNSSGHYEFNVATGNYTIRVGQTLSTRVNGMTFTYEPDEAEEDDYCGTGSHTCNNATTVNTSDTDATTQDFGFFAAIDMGDLPSGYDYTITMDEEGPIHIDVDGTGGTSIRLGANWDSELDGAPDDGAGMNGGSTGGDDNLGTDDEDGVTFANAWQPGGTAQITFTVTNNDTNTYKPYLVGWFDWDNSGDLYGDGEMAISQDIACLPADSPCTVQIDVPIPSDAYEGDINMRFRIYATQSPPPVIAPTGTVINGEVEDYQRNNTPTAITLASFEVTPQDEAILITWETATELDNVGFNLYRSTAAAGPYTLLNAALIPPQFPGEAMGGTYEWLDTDVQPDATYYYKLEDIDVNGASTFNGPVSTTVVNAPTSVSVQNMAARNGLALLVLGMVAVMGVLVTQRRKH